MYEKPDFASGSLFFVGTATVVLRYARFTILTDPNDWVYQSTSTITPCSSRRLRTLCNWLKKQGWMDGWSISATLRLIYLMCLPICGSRYRSCQCDRSWGFKRYQETSSDRVSVSNSSHYQFSFRHNASALLSSCPRKACIKVNASNLFRIIYDFNLWFQRISVVIELWIF